MPCQNGNHKASLFIHYKHRHIVQFIRKKWGDSPDRNSTGSDKKKTPALLQLTTGPFGKRLFHIRESAFCKVLFCKVLFCKVLFCNVLFCNVLFCNVLFRMGTLRIKAKVLLCLPRKCLFDF